MVNGKNIKADITSESSSEDNVTGFSTSSCFTSTVKKHKGETPKQFGHFDN